MTALSADRNTPLRDGKMLSLPVEGGKKIYAGAIVVLNAAGYAEPATTATGKTAIGRAEAQVDNTAGADGDVSITVHKGVFRYANSAAGDAIARTEIGDTCYLVDDQTVAKTDGAGTRSAAGTVVDVDAQGVWVKFE